MRVRSRWGLGPSFPETVSGPAGHADLVKNQTDTADDHACDTHGVDGHALIQAAPADEAAAIVEATSGGEYMVSPHLGTPAPPATLVVVGVTSSRADVSSRSTSRGTNWAGVSVSVPTLLVLDDVDGSLPGG